MTGGNSLRARVLVVEDNAFTRTTVCGALRDAGINVVADTGSASEALEIARRVSPHAAVLDLDLGRGPTGIDVAVALREEFPTIGIVILTSYGDPRLTGRNVSHIPGGSVYLVKSDLSSAQALADAVDNSLRLAASPGAPGRSALPVPRGSTAGLTDAQVEVARMVAEGLSNAEIAARRGVSAPSVERIIMRVARELGIESTSATNRRVLIAREYLRQAGADLDRDGSPGR
jgi:DNA-binding NarL/FixJ family response regulator